MQTTHTNLNDKNNAFNLSAQVKTLLHEKGVSFLFNYTDYQHFKNQCKNAFNKAQAIAEKFTEENQSQNSDFNEYVF